MTEINLSKAIENPNLNQDNLVSNKTTKSFKTWARVDQILNIISGVFSFPFGIPGIVAGIKLNKAIENVETVSQDKATQEFVESVKEFHKWAVIKVITMFVATLLIGVLFGALFASGFFAAMNEAKSQKLQTYPSNTYQANPATDLRTTVDNSNQAIDSTTTKPFSMQTEEGNVTMDASGNMIITDKDGKVTTMNFGDLAAQ
jgi:hypothetical protein